MIKTLLNVQKQDKDRFKIPRNVQNAIPVDTVYDDGVFCIGKGLYSKTYKFTDINYAVASLKDKETMFLAYSELINSFEVGATTKITLSMNDINRANFEKEILLPYKEDGLDLYRRELNQMLLNKVSGANGIMMFKYLTVTVAKSSVQEARNFFRRVGTEYTAHLARLGSKCTELDTTERLRFLHDFYRPEEHQSFAFDMSAAMKRGHNFKDAVCPDTMEFRADHFRMGERFGRVLFLKDWASYIKDDMITELTDINRNVMLSIDVIPVPTDEAVREVENRLLGVETNITNWQRRQNQNNNFSAVVPYDMEQQRKESKEFLGDLTSRDQRMMFGVVTVVHTADTLEQLDTDTDTLKTIARKHLCQLGTLKYQQLDGLNTVLPVGLRRIDTFRTLTTESLAVLMPFRVQEVMDKGGIYFGDNAISKNPIICNKEFLLNYSAFLLGVPGSGKSFSAKEQIAFVALTTDDDILIFDPSREYNALVEALGGESIRIAAGSADYINALDMVEGYGDGSDPVIDKSEFVLSLFELLERKGIGSKEKSIIDRCVSAVYADYKDGSEPPTLCTLREKLMEQREPEAHELALALELFTSGTLNAFAHPTNVDTQNRLIVYDTMDLGKQLKTMGLLVITDAMLNRVTQNWRNGKRTHLFIDEFHIAFENEYGGSFFNSAWRTFRKRNAYPTAITQNVEYLLDSVLASTMLSNSEFLVMLNQSATDREKLAKLLNISNEQMSYVSNAEEGCGLIKYGSAIVPFENRFPKNTKLYKLMSTKPNEKFT